MRREARGIVQTVVDIVGRRAEWLFSGDLGAGEACWSCHKPAIGHGQRDYRGRGGREAGARLGSDELFG
jgi:hypothetical protein